MMRLKLIQSQDENLGLDIEVQVTAKNRHYDKSLILVDDPYLETIEFIVKDSVGNLIQPKRRNQKQGPSYSTIEAKAEETVLLGRWLFNHDHFSAVSAFCLWDLNKYVGQKILLEACYHLQEPLASSISTKANIPVDLITEKSRPLTIELPLLVS